MLDFKRMARNLLIMVASALITIVLGLGFISTADADEYVPPVDMWVFTAAPPQSLEECTLAGRLALRVAQHLQYDPLFVQLGDPFYYDVYNASKYIVGQGYGPDHEEFVPRVVQLVMETCAWHYGHGLRMNLEAARHQQIFDRESE